jgi:quinolinate synthase
MNDLIEKIQRLKRERNAVILAHNYQRDEIQDIADFVGDSLELSRMAAANDAEVVVFCGVYFMAETAAILSPEKTVLIPDRNAGCPLANMLSPRELAELKAGHPDAAVVTYVNSSAEVKALSDVCCTSSNAVEMVSRIPAGREIIFVPDRNLGSYAAEKSGRDLILWNGYCPTHQRVAASDISRLKQEHPGAVAAVHPECPKDVRDCADFVGSTSTILRFCRESRSREFIIGTEVGILHRLHGENRGKTFYPASPFMDCPNMKLITLEKLLWSLEDASYEVRVPEPMASQARLAIERMLE